MDYCHRIFWIHSDIATTPHITGLTFCEEIIMPVQNNCLPEKKENLPVQPWLL